MALNFFDKINHIGSGIRMSKDIVRSAKIAHADRSKYEKINFAPLTAIVWLGKIMVTMPGIFPNENLKKWESIPESRIDYRGGVDFRE